MVFRRSLLCGLLFTVVLQVAACDYRQQISDGTDVISETEIPGDQDETEHGDVADSMEYSSLEISEIQSLLESGETGVFWETNDVSLASSIALYEVEAVDNRAVWDELFSGLEIISEQRLGEESEICELTMAADGNECMGRIYDDGTIEAWGELNLFPGLSGENLADALSAFTGMDCDFENTAEGGWNCQFSVDGFGICDGYVIGENVYLGPSVSGSDTFMSCYIPFVLGERGDVLESADLFSMSQIKELCVADLTAQMTVPGIVVLTQAEPGYIYQAQEQMLCPVLLIKGESHILSDDGVLYSDTTTQMIDIQTGEMYLSPFQ